MSPDEISLLQEILAVLQQIQQEQQAQTALLSQLSNGLTPFGGHNVN